jgi:hypothetical protein
MAESGYDWYLDVRLVDEVERVGSLLYC